VSKHRIPRPTPALVIAAIALFAALGGSVYAATGKINGKSVRIKSLPGNRLKPGSVPANRLQPGVLAGFGGTVTGAQIDERSLGQVPSADYADSAGVAQSAVDAQTALNAVNAVDAETVNGHGAGCLPGTQPFAGACWQSSQSEAAATAPVAATSCATQGGSLPEALELAAFAQQPGVALEGEEWSRDLTTFSGENAFAVVTVNAAGALNSKLSTEVKKYRCVIPLVI
jgi:hypothetical protein